MKDIHQNIGILEVLAAGTTRNLKREFGGVAIDRNQPLAYTHYIVRGGIAEVYVSDEIRQLGVPFKRLKDFVIEEVQRVSADPFGESSVDPDVASQFARERRAINKLRTSIPVAVKSVMPGTFHEREDLLKQYLFMRNLQFVAYKKMSEAQKESIEFLPVYAAIRVGDVECLLMKLVEDASQIEDKTIPFRVECGWPGSGDPISELVFKSDDYPELVSALGFMPGGELRWRSVRRELSKILGVDLEDLTGRNVIFNHENGKRKYYIIDQKERL